jgi:hypothetical protein
MANRRLEVQDELAWNRTSQVLAMIYSANRGPRGRKLEAKDFHPYAKQRERELDQVAPLPKEPITVLRDFFILQRPRC